MNTVLSHRWRCDASRALEETHQHCLQYQTLLEVTIIDGHGTSVMGVMKIGNISHRADFEPTLLAIPGATMLAIILCMCLGMGVSSVG